MKIEADFPASFKFNIFMEKSSFGFARIKSGFTSFSNDVFLLMCRVILGALTGNSYFPNPTPALADFENAINNFSALMAIAKTGSKRDRITRNAARKVLQVLAKNLADYCTYVAQGDILALASSGFDLAKVPGPIMPLPLPQRFKVTNGLNSGELRLSVKGEKLAKLYSFQYTTQELGLVAVEEIQWITVVDTKSKFTLTGLTPGQKYTMRVTLSGVGGQVTYSNTISQICQ